MPPDERQFDTTDEATSLAEGRAKRRAAEQRDVDVEELSSVTVDDRGRVVGATTPERLKEQAAAQSSAYDPGDFRVEDGQVELREAAIKREAAEDSPFPAEAFEVEDGELVPPDPTERVDVTVWSDEISGDVELVGPDGRRDLGADAGGDDPFFARIDAPDREGEYRIEVGGETVEQFEIGPAGAAVDDPGDLSYGWNGAILSADRGDTGVEQTEYDPDERYLPASADPDVVAGAGAAEALQAGFTPEQLSGRGPITEQEGAELSDAVADIREQREQGTQQTPFRDTIPVDEAQGTTRSRIAFGTTRELDFGTASPGPPRRRITPAAAEVFADDELVGRQTTTGGQPSAGEIRAAVNRLGQQQLSQQAVGRVGGGPEATTPGLVDRILDADANPEIADDLTDSGGLFAEEGDSGAPLTDLTGVSEADLRDPSDNILPGVLPTREQVRRGGADEAAAIPFDPEQRGSTAGEGVPERLAEGAATTGLSFLNVRQRAADAEQLLEGAQALPRETREEGAGNVGETLTALARREGAETARRAQAEPVRFGSGLVLDVAGGAVATGRTPGAGDVRAELDPRIGLFGETLESRALGLRDDGSDGGGADVDVDRSQTRGDQVSRLPGERPTGLTAEAVDEARDISGPSRRSRVRGELSRGVGRVRERVQDAREQVSVETRVGAGLGSVEVRRESDTAPDSPSDFAPSRDEVLAGSPRDLLADEIAGRQRTARRQSAGDFEGAPAPFRSDDGGTFDPTADADARRRAAERRFVERETDVDLDDDGLAETVAPDARGGVAGALFAGALARDEQAQEPAVTQETGERARPDSDADVFSDFTTDVDVRDRVGTRPDMDTRQDVDTRQDIDPLDRLDQRQDPDRRDPDRRDPDPADQDPFDIDPRDLDPRDPDDRDSDRRRRDDDVVRGSDGQFRSGSIFDEDRYVANVQGVSDVLF
jgi:hypothetical protein